MITKTNKYLSMFVNIVYHKLEIFKTRLKIFFSLYGKIGIFLFFFSERFILILLDKRRGRVFCSLGLSSSQFHARDV